MEAPRARGQSDLKHRDRGSRARARPGFARVEAIRGGKEPRRMSGLSEEWCVPGLPVHMGNRRAKLLPETSNKRHLDCDHPAARAAGVRVVRNRRQGNVKGTVGPKDVTGGTGAAGIAKAGRPWGGVTGLRWWCWVLLKVSELRASPVPSWRGPWWPAPSWQRSWPVPSWLGSSWPSPSWWRWPWPVPSWLGSSWPSPS
jgi:hypothetical protein